MFPLCLVLCIADHLGKALAFGEEIDYDLLVENLTRYNDSDLFVRNRNMMDLNLNYSPPGEAEVWTVLGGLVLFTVLFSLLIIFGTILSDKNVLRR